MTAFPFRDTPADDRPPVQVFNVRYLSRRRAASAEAGDGERRDTAGTLLLAVSSVLLLALAIAQGYVSYRAQYSFVHAIKHESAASVLESLGLDCAAVIFALLALAQARLGRPALAERVLNLACVCGSLVMNAMSADFTDPKSVAVWTLPAALYAAASDRLIAVVRRRALAARQDGEDRSPLAAAGGAALWALRFALAPVTTWRGFRAWVLESAPVAPGRHALPAPADRPALDHPAPVKALPASDTGGAAVADTTTDTPADTAPPPARRPAARTSDRRPAARTATSKARTADRKADKARALLTADPAMTGAELGRRLKVSERTGLRLRGRILTETTPPATDTPADEMTALDSTTPARIDTAMAEGDDAE